jgi:hypothetical protein
MPTFPSQAKKPRGPQKFYRGSVIQERADAQHDTGYGENGFTGSSSVMGVGKVASNLSDMDTAAPKGDPVLDAVIKGGAPAAGDWQTRKVDASGRPAAHGMVNQQAAKPAAALPSSTTRSPVDDSAARRAQRLKS